MTTTIAGNAKWESCWRQAAYLSALMYKDPPPPGGTFNTQYPDRISEAEAHWEEWDKVDEHVSTGLVGRLYKVKGWDHEGEEAPPCPPCLAFRGTDFDDMRDLALSATIRWRVLRVVGWTHEFTHVLDPTLSKRVKWVAGKGYPIPDPYTRDELINMGFEAIPIMRDTGDLSVESAAPGQNISVNLQLTLDILAKENGDWNSNIKQGLGRPSAQYKNAKTFGNEIVDEKIKPLHDKRLEITGHSLGGGLAAAVTCVLDRNHPSVHFHGMIFNSAGVHPNTVAPASLSDGSINNFTVEDEILTTIQSYTSRIPVIGSIFRMAERTIGQKGMPEALGTRRVIPGCSPGSGHFGDKGTPLPNLFPIKNQNAVPEYTGDFPVLTQLDGMLQSSGNITQFGTSFARWLNRRYRDQAIQNNRDSDENYWFPERIDRTYKEMIRLLQEDIQPEIDAVVKIMMMSVEYHGMDFVIAAYDSAHPPQ